MQIKKVSKKTVAKKPLKKKVVKKVIKKPVTKKKIVKKVIKKTIKKKAVTAKKTTRKSKNKKALVFANDQTSFWVSDGQILNSLVALRDALDEMEREVYQYHSGNAQNDFANWVAAVLCDYKCATELERAKTQKSAKTVIVRHLKTYSI